MADGTGKTKFGYVAAGDNGALQLATETGPMGAPAEYGYGYDELGRMRDGSSMDGIAPLAKTNLPLGG